VSISSKTQKFQKKNKAKPKDKNTYKRETGIKRHFPCIKTFEDKMGS
jgi:hypothetical protein